MIERGSVFCFLSRFLPPSLSCLSAARVTMVYWSVVQEYLWQPFFGCVAAVKLRVVHVFSFVLSVYSVVTSHPSRSTCPSSSATNPLLDWTAYSTAKQNKARVIDITHIWWHPIQVHPSDCMTRVWRSCVTYRCDTILFRYNAWCTVNSVFEDSFWFFTFPLGGGLADDKSGDFCLLWEGMGNEENPNNDQCRICQQSRLSLGLRFGDFFMLWRWAGLSWQRERKGKKKKDRGGEREREGGREKKGDDCHVINHKMNISCLVFYMFVEMYIYIWIYVFICDKYICVWICIRVHISRALMS